MNIIKNIRHHARQAAGFVMLDMLISLVVASIVMGLSFGSYLAVAKLMEAGKRKARAQNTVHLLIERLTADCTYTVQEVVEGTGQWTLHDATGHEIQYRYANGQLWRNDRPMVASGLRLSDFVWTWEKSATDERRLVRIRLAVEGRDDRLERQTAFTVRQQPAWTQPESP